MDLAVKTVKSVEDLLHKAREGEVQAFTALVKLYEERIFHTACSLVGNREDARDLAQETFVKAYHGLKNFQGKSQFSTWLTRILINTAKDFIRKKQARTFESVLENVPAKNAGALEGLVNQELEAALHEAMQGLPFQQKSLFALRYLEGLSLEEIAETSGLSIGGVKASLWQAAQKMKKKLRPWMEKEGSL